MRHLYSGGESNYLQWERSDKWTGKSLQSLIKGPVHHVFKLN